ncbi:hypothetical protein ES705_47234 [subsurface metagenome]
MRNKISQCILRLKFNQPLSQKIEAKDLRGAIANRNRDKSLFHQHTANGDPIYKYPLVQYKIIKGEGFLIGLNEGAKAITILEILKEEFKLCGEKYMLLQNELKFHSTLIEINKEFLAYHFFSPWLALNEKNYERYKDSNLQEQIQLLKKILIGNILSMAKGLEYVVTEEIKVQNLRLKIQDVKVKDIKMIGFIGDFEVNFNLPDYIGLGKMVSHGFGTIKKINN